MISYGRQYIDQKDIKAVSSVLKSNWLTQGPQVEKFEKTGRSSLLLKVQRGEETNWVTIKFIDNLVFKEEFNLFFSVF